MIQETTNNHCDFRVGTRGVNQSCVLVSSTSAARTGEKLLTYYTVQEEGRLVRIKSNSLSLCLYSMYLQVAGICVIYKLYI
jgi:hypothetical protein